MKTLVRCPRGAEPREVPLEEVVIPDLWHVAKFLEGVGEPRAGRAVLECWHLAHDMLIALKVKGVD